MSPKSKHPTTCPNDKSGRKEHGDEPCIAEELSEARGVAQFYLHVTSGHVAAILSHGLFSPNNDLMLRLAGDLARVLSDKEAHDEAVQEYIATITDYETREALQGHWVLGEADLAEAAFAVGLRVGQALSPLGLMGLQCMKGGAK